MNQQQPPTTVSDIYYRWLRPEDLRDKPHTVTIKSAQAALYRQRNGDMEWRIVLAFENARKEMILNKTQATAITEATGTGTYHTWPGTRITIAPGTAPNGKATIIITRASAGAPQPPPPSVDTTTGEITDPSDDDEFNKMFPRRGNEL